MSEKKMNVKKKKLYELLYEMNYAEQKIVKLFYGLDGEKKLKKSEIASLLGLKEKYVSNFLKSVVDRLDDMTYEQSKKNFDFYQVEKVDEKTQKLIEQMSDAFFNMFPNVDQISVEDSLDILPRKHREIIFLYYGLDGVHCLDYDEIADKYRITVDKVDEIIESSIDKIKIFFSVEKKKPRDGKTSKHMLLVSQYGNDNVEKALEVFEKEKRDIIKTYFLLGNKMNYTEVGEKYGYSSRSIYRLVNDGISKLEEVLYASSLSNDMNSFYANFKGITKEEVDAVVSLLSANSQKLIKGYYGIDGEKLSLSELAKIAEVSEAKVVEKINKIIKRISKKFKKEETINTDSFYEKFENYTKEEVDIAINKLDERTREIISLYYGLFGEKIDKYKIAQKFGVSMKNVYVIASKATGKILNILGNTSFNLENPAKYKKNKIEESKKNDVGLLGVYGKEKIKEVLPLLSARSQEYIKLYYGIDCAPLSKKEIALKYNVCQSTVCVGINRGENQLKNILDKKNGNVSRKSEFYSEFVGYSPERVNETLDKLEKRSQEFIKFYYGLYGEKMMSQKEIAEKYGISPAAVSIGIRKAIETLKKLLKGQQEVVRQTQKCDYFELVKKYGEDEVNKAFAYIDEGKREMVYSYYGVNSREKKKQSELSKEYLISAAAVSHSIKKCLETVESIINNPKKEIDKRELFYSKFSGFEREQVDEAMLLLAKYNQDLIKSYYGLQEEPISISLIASKYNISKSTVASNISRGLIKLKKVLENPEEHKSEKEKFYKLFEGCNKEQVDDALLKLDDKSRNLIELFYGLQGDKVEQKKLSQKYGVSQPSISHSISSGISKMKVYLNKGKEVEAILQPRDFKFKILLERYGESLVEETMNELSDAQKGFLVMYYTLGNVKKYTLSEIAEKINVDESKLTIVESKIIEMLEGKVKEKLNDKKIAKKRKEFTLLIKDKAKAKVAMTALDKKEMAVVALYYGLDGKNILSLEELGEKFGVEKDEVEELIKKVIVKINDYMPKEKR